MCSHFLKLKFPGDFARPYRYRNVIENVKTINLLAIIVTEILHKYTSVKILPRSTCSYIGHS